MFNIGFELVSRLVRKTKGINACLIKTFMCARTKPNKCAYMFVL